MKQVLRELQEASLWYEARKTLPKGGEFLGHTVNEIIFPNISIFVRQLVQLKSGFPLVLCSNTACGYFCFHDYR